jgi:hypothetical protein
MSEVAYYEPTSPELSTADLLHHLADELDLGDHEFETAVATLSRLLAERADGECLEELAEVATTVFNAGNLQRAARLFAIADTARRQVADSLGLDYDLGDGVPSTQLALANVAGYLADRDLYAELRTVLRFFPDLSVEGLLDRLASERSVTRRAFIVDLLIVHGEDAVLPVLNLLEWPSEARANDVARFTANLLGILIRFEHLSVADRRRAATLAGRYLTSDEPIVREAALDAVDHIGGTEAVNLTIGALRASSYKLDGSKLPTELCNHFGRAMDIVAWWGGERELVYIAEIATGGRNCGFKVAQALERLAAEALAKRDEPLPPRAARVIASHLRSIASQPFRLLTGQLLHTAEAKQCVRLVGLLDGSSDPEAREVLEHEGLQRLVARIGVIAAA